MKCQTNVYDQCKQTGKPIQRCPNGNRHVYKVYISVPGSKNARRTKKLDTRDINEAIEQALAFEKEVKTSAKGNQSMIQTKKQVDAEIPGVAPVLLIEGMARYVGFLKNENVPAHRRSERSNEHIKDVERAFTLVVQCLKENGHDCLRLRMDQVDDGIVGNIYDYLLHEKQFANATFNRYLSHCSSLFSWYGEEYTPIKNWFESVPRKKAVGNTNAITRKEYLSLLERITPQNGIKKYPNGVKPERNLYRPWLKDGIRLGMETGRCREEITQMKFSDIVVNVDGGYIKVEDRKVNHMQNRVADEEKKYVYVPLTDSLRELLLEMGWDKYKDTDAYVLAPEESIDRRLMCDLLSRGFAHFNHLGAGRKLSFKSLRKAYITALSLYMGGNAKAISGHSSDAVIDEHYRNKAAIAKAANGFNPLTMTREVELDGTRNQSIDKPTLTINK